MSTLSQRIQCLRKNNGLSQEELAEKLNVSRQAVSKWESGQSVPDVEKILALSKYFQVSTDFLLKGNETAPTSSTKNTYSVGPYGLLLASILCLVLGLTYAVARWNDEQTALCLWGGFLIQAIGILLYGLAYFLDRTKIPGKIRWLVICLAAYLPLCFIVTFLCWGIPTAYPLDLTSLAVFVVVYGSVVFFAYKKTHAQNRSDH